MSIPLPSLNLGQPPAAAPPKSSSGIDYDSMFDEQEKMTEEEEKQQQYKQDKKKSANDPDAKAQEKMEKDMEKMAKEHQKEKEKEMKAEDILKHQAMLLKLNAYLNHPRFLDFFKQHGFSFTNEKLRQMSIAQMDELLARAKLTLRSKNRAEWVTTAALAGVGMIEALATTSEAVKAKVDITGTTHLLTNNEQFLDILAEIELDYSALTNMGPEKLLMMCIGQTMAKAHTANLGVKFVQAQVEALQKMQQAAGATAETATAETASTEEAEETISFGPVWDPSSIPAPAAPDSSSSSSSSTSSSLGIS